MQALYPRLRLYVNFFQPCLKLTRQQRDGAKVKQPYDTAPTPYPRLLQSQALTKEQTDHLATQYDSMNPAQLGRALGAAKERLWMAAKVRSENEPTKASG